MTKDTRAVVLLDLDDTILDFGIAEHEALKKPSLLLALIILKLYSSATVR